MLFRSPSNQNFKEKLKILYIFALSESVKTHFDDIGTLNVRFTQYVNHEMEKQYITNTGRFLQNRNLLKKIRVPGNNIEQMVRFVSRALLSCFVDPQYCVRSSDFKLHLRVMKNRSTACPRNKPHWFVDMPCCDDHRHPACYTH